MDRLWMTNDVVCGLYVRRRTDGGAECTEDGRIGATEYAGWNGTRKRGGSAERSEETGRDAEHIT